MPAHRLWMKSGASGRAENFYHAVIITDVITDEDGRVIDYLIHSNTINEEDYPVSAYGYTCQILVKICGWN